VRSTRPGAFERQHRHGVELVDAGDAPRGQGSRKLRHINAERQMLRLRLPARYLLVEAPQPMGEVRVLWCRGQDQAVAPVVRRVRWRAHDDAIVALDDLAAEAAGQQVRAPAETELVDLQKPAACPSRRESLAAT
jgi:hypothetical protein